jgi:hypothetical protein
MNKLTRVLALFLALGLLLTGCSEDQPGVLQPNSADNHFDAPTEKGKLPLNSAALVMPENGTFLSATLHVYVTASSNRFIVMRRITGEWDEATVTWNNFGGSYAPDLFGNFYASMTGWYTANVSALVEGWINETYPNYGLLLEQVNGAYPRTDFSSREGSFAPYLEVCYSTPEGTVCEQIPAAGDAYIASFMGDVNTGSSPVLYTGYWPEVCDVGYLSLIKFEGPQQAPGKASIGDRVWLDQNENGIQDVGEAGFPNVTVNLYDCAEQFIATMVTDGNGFYLFQGLEPEVSYFVEFILPTGYDFTLPDQGLDDAFDSDANPVTGRTVCTLLSEDEVDLTWDAGLVEVPQCGPCEGKVTQLTIQYNGNKPNAHIVVKQKFGIVAFDGIVQPGGQFTFYGQDRHGTLGPEIYFYVNGCYKAKIHTSCSQPIYPGLTAGPFTIIEGYSRFGGLLCPL